MNQFKGLIMSTENQIYTANDAYSRRVDLRRDPANSDQWQMNRMVQAARSASWEFSSTGWIPCNPPDMLSHGVLPVYNGRVYNQLPADALDMDSFVAAVNNRTA